MSDIATMIMIWAWSVGMVFASGWAFGVYRCTSDLKREWLKIEERETNK